MDARQLISEIVACDANAPVETELQALEGWDSIMAVRLIIRLEGVLGRELDEDEIDGLRSIGDVETLLGECVAR